jgi:APA family basic amino acid/polyamine antiporter
MANQSTNPNTGIGLAGAVSTLLGLVLGGSIFVLPGALAAKAGPGVILSMALASIVAIFSCVITAQLASVATSNAGTTTIIQNTLGTRWSFYTGWMMLAAAAMAISLLAYGNAGFIAVWFPDVNKHYVAIATILLIAAVNMTGVRTGVRLQIYFVAFKIAVLFTFCVIGLWHIDTRLLVPFFPSGYKEAIIGSIPAFYAYVGFSVLLEIGGQIRKPKRNIPIALGIGFGILLVLYTLVPIILVGVIPWHEYSSISSPLAEAAKRFLPNWFVQAIVAAGIVSCVATINSVMIAYTHTVVYVAKAGYLPKILTTSTGPEATPVASLIFFSVISIVGTSLGDQLDQYAIFVVGGMMIANIMLSLAVIRLPRKMASQFAEAKIHLNRPNRLFFGVGLIVLSCAMLIIGLSSAPRVAAYFGLFVLFGIGLDIFRSIGSTANTVELQE